MHRNRTTASSVEKMELARKLIYKARVLREEERQNEYTPSRTPTCTFGGIDGEARSFALRVPRARLDIFPPTTE